MVDMVKTQEGQQVGLNYTFVKQQQEVGATDSALSLQLTFTVGFAGIVYG